jgi:hypothetical protein
VVAAECRIWSAAALDQTRQVPPPQQHPKWQEYAIAIHRRLQRGSGRHGPGSDSAHPARLAERHMAGRGGRECSEAPCRAGCVRPPFRPLVVVHHPIVRGVRVITWFSRKLCQRGRVSSYIAALRTNTTDNQASAGGLIPQLRKATARPTWLRVLLLLSVGLGETQPSCHSLHASPDEEHHLLPQLVCYSVCCWRSRPAPKPPRPTQLQTRVRWWRQAFNRPKARAAWRQRCAYRAKRSQLLLALASCCSRPLAIGLYHADYRLRGMLVLGRPTAENGTAANSPDDTRSIN